MVQPFQLYNYRYRDELYSFMSNDKDANVIEVREDCLVVEGEYEEIVALLDAFKAEYDTDVRLIGGAQ